jgi:hypothetical protein
VDLGHLVSLVRLVVVLVHRKPLCPPGCLGYGFELICSGPTYPGQQGGIDGPQTGLGGQQGGFGGQQGGLGGQPGSARQGGQGF